MRFVSAKIFVKFRNNIKNEDNTKRGNENDAFTYINYIFSIY